MESPRRGDEFVTKKIVNYLKYFKKWDNYTAREQYWFGPSFAKLKLGNLEAKRDWSYCKDSAEAIYLVGEQDNLDEYIIASGETHTIKEFLVEAARQIGIDDIFFFVEIDDNLKRPCEVPYLCGRPTKIRNVLGWEAKTKFQDLIKIMMED